MGTCQSPRWWDAACSQTWPQSSTALQTPHEDSCTGQGTTGRTGKTLCGDNQTLQPSISNLNESCLLSRYLQSLPYTLYHKLLSRIRFHILVGHLKNHDLKQCDLGKNSEEHLPHQDCSAKDLCCSCNSHNVATYRYQLSLSPLSWYCCSELQLQAHKPCTAASHKPKYLFIWNKISSWTILQVQDKLLFQPGTSIPSVDRRTRNYQQLWQHQIRETVYIYYTSFFPFYTSIFPCDCMASKVTTSRRLIHPCHLVENELRWY